MLLLSRPNSKKNDTQASPLHPAAYSKTQHTLYHPQCPSSGVLAHTPSPLHPMAIKVMFALDEFEKGFQHVFVRKDGRQGVASCNRITLTSFCTDFASVACRGGGFQFSRGQQVDGCFFVLRLGMRRLGFGCRGWGMFYFGCRGKGHFLCCWAWAFLFLRFGPERERQPFCGGE